MRLEIWCRGLTWKFWGGGVQFVIVELLWGGNTTHTGLYLLRTSRPGRSNCFQLVALCSDVYIYIFAMLYFKKGIVIEFYYLVWNKGNLFILRLRNQCVSVCVTLSLNSPTQKTIVCNICRECPTCTIEISRVPCCTFIQLLIFFHLGLRSSRYLLSLPATLAFDALLDLPHVWKGNGMIWGHCNRSRLWRHKFSEQRILACALWKVEQARGPKDGLLLTRLRQIVKKQIIRKKNNHAFKSVLVAFTQPGVRWT